MSYVKWKQREIMIQKNVSGNVGNGCYLNVNGSFVVIIIDVQNDLIETMVKGDEE